MKPTTAHPKAAIAFMVAIALLATALASHGDTIYVTSVNTIRAFTTDGVGSLFASSGLGFHTTPS